MRLPISDEYNLGHISHISEIRQLGLLVKNREFSLPLSFLLPSVGVIALEFMEILVAESFTDLTV